MLINTYGDVSGDHADVSDLVDDVRDDRGAVYDAAKAAEDARKREVYGDTLEGWLVNRGERLQWEAWSASEYLRRKKEEGYFRRTGDAAVDEARRREWAEKGGVVNSFIDEREKAGLRPWADVEAWHNRVRRHAEERRRVEFDDFWDARLNGDLGNQPEADAEVLGQFDVEGGLPETANEFKAAYQVGGYLAELKLVDEKVLKDDPLGTMRAVVERLNEDKGLKLDVAYPATALFGYFSDVRRRAKQDRVAYGKVVSDAWRAGLMGETLDDVMVVGERSVSADAWSRGRGLAHWQWRKGQMDARRLRGVAEMVKEGLDWMEHHADNFLAADLSEQDVAVDRALDALVALPDEDRGVVYEMLRRDSANDGGVWDRLVKAVNRGAFMVAQEGPAKLASGWRSTMDAVMGNEEGEMYEKRRLAQYEVLSGFLKGEYRPVRSEKYGSFLNGVFDAAQSVPMMASAFAGPGGVILLGSAYAGDSYGAAVERNVDGMTGMQFLSSLVSGGVQGGFDYAGTRIMAGLAGFGGKSVIGRKTMEWVERKDVLAGGRGWLYRTAVRGGKAGAGTLLEEGITENAQDVADVVAQQVGAYLGGYDSGIDWEKWVKDEWHGQEDLFWAILPFAIVGVGARGMKEALGRDGVDQHVYALKRMGVTDGQIDQILKQEDAETQVRMAGTMVLDALRRKYPAEMGMLQDGIAANDVAGVRRLAEVSGMSVEDVLGNVDSKAKFDGVEVSSIRLRLNDAGVVETFVPEGDGLVEVPEDVVPEVAHDTRLEALRERAALLESLGLPLIEVEQDGDVVTGYRFTAEDGEVLRFKTWDDAVNGLNVEQAALEERMAKDGLELLSGRDAGEFEGVRQRADREMAGMFRRADPEGERFGKQEVDWSREKERMTVAGMEGRGRMFGRFVRSQAAMAAAHAGLDGDVHVEDVPVWGYNYLKTLQDGVKVWMQELYAGHDPLDVCEERAEAAVKNEVVMGRVPVEVFEGWLRQLERVSGKEWLMRGKSEEERLQAAADGMGKVFRAYVLGKVKEDVLPQGMRLWIRRMLIWASKVVRFWRDVENSRLLLSPEVKAGMDGRFWGFMDDVLGVDVQAQVGERAAVEKVRLEAPKGRGGRKAGKGPGPEPEFKGDTPEQWKADREWGRMKALGASPEEEVGIWIQGRLPAPERAGARFAGVLEEISDALGEEERKGFFADGEVDWLSLVNEARREGFPVRSAEDLLEVVRDSVTGKEGFYPMREQLEPVEAMPGTEEDLPKHGSFSIGFYKMEYLGEDPDRRGSRFERREGVPVAPNGKLSNLDEVLWRWVRSRGFKEVYGDWEAAGVKRFLQGEPIERVEGEVFPDNGESLEDRVASWLSGYRNGVARNPMIGDVKLDRRAVRDSWREGRVRLRGEAYRLVPAIIEQGRMIGQVDNYKGKPGVTRFLLAAPVSMDGKVYYGVVAVQQSYEMQRFTFHDVYTVERVQQVGANGEMMGDQSAGTLGPLGSESKLVTYTAADPSGNFDERGGVVNRKEGGRGRSGSSVEPVLAVLRRILAVRENEVKVSLDENGEPRVTEEMMEDGVYGSSSLDVERDGQGTMVDDFIDAVSGESREKMERVKAAVGRLESVLKENNFTRNGDWIGGILHRSDEMPEKVRNVIAVTDAMYRVVPVEVRGRLKLGRWRNQALDALRPEDRAEAFGAMVREVNRVLEEWITEKRVEGVKRLIRWSRGRTGVSRVLRGKLTAEMQNRIQFIDDVLHMDGEEVDKAVAAAEAEAAVATSEEEMRQKMQRVHLLNMYGGLIERDEYGHYLASSAEAEAAYKLLYVLYRRGRMARMAEEEARIRRNQEIREGLVEGLKFDSSVHASRKNEREKMSPGERMRNTVAELLNFEGFLKVHFGEHNKAVQMMMDGVRKARLGYYRDARARQERFWKKGAEIFGVKPEEQGKVLRGLAKLGKERKWGIQMRNPGKWGKVVLNVQEAKDLYEGQGRLDSAPAWVNDSKAWAAFEVAYKEYVDRREFGRVSRNEEQAKEISFRVLFPGEVFEDLVMSDLQAGTLLLMADQGSCLKNLDGEGYTEEVVNEVRKKIDPKALALAYYFAEEYRRDYDGLNEVYRRLFGLDMPHVTNYAPTFYYHEMGRQDARDPLEMQGSGWMSPGSIKKRVNHVASPRIVSCVSAYWSHTRQMDHWKNFASVNRDMRANLLSAAVTVPFEAQYGPAARGGLSRWVEVMENEGPKARNGINSDHWIERMMRNTSLGALAFNVKTMIRQFPAMLGAMVEMPALEATKGFVSLLAHPGQLKDVWESDSVQQRLWIGMSPEMQHAMEAARINPSRLSRFAEWGMMGVQYADAAFTVVSGGMAYAFARKETLRGGVPEEVAKAAGIEAMDRVVRRTAQPNTVEQKSLRENYAGSLGRMLFMFRSDQRKQVGLCLEAAWLALKKEMPAHEAARRIFQGWVVYGMMNSLATAAIASLFWSGDDDDERELWEKMVQDLAVGGLAGAASAIPFFEEAVNYAASFLTDTEVFTFASDPLSTVSRGVRGGGQVLAMLEDEEDWDEEKVVKGLNAICQALNGLGVVGAMSDRYSDFAVAAQFMARTGKDVYMAAGKNIPEMFSDAAQEERRRMKVLARFAGDAKDQVQEDKKHIRSVFVEVRNMDWADRRQVYQREGLNVKEVRRVETMIRDVDIPDSVKRLRGMDKETRYKAAEEIMSSMDEGEKEVFVRELKKYGVR